MTLGLALLGSSLALAFSLWAGKTHDALLGTYAILALWLLCRPMIGEAGASVCLESSAADAIDRSLPPRVCTVLGCPGA